jgi:hypothetical protein
MQLNHYIPRSSESSKVNTLILLFEEHCIEKKPPSPMGYNGVNRWSATVVAGLSKTDNEAGMASGDPIGHGEYAQVCTSCGIVGVHS